MDLATILASMPGIKLDFSKNTTTNIHIEGNCITQNRQKIGGEKEINKLIKELQKSKKEDTFPAQILNKDLLPEFRQTENNSIKNSEIKILKETLPKEEMKPILFAKSIYSSILKGNSKNNLSELIIKLEKTYPRKGKRILNLMTAGYFENMIIPMINLCKEKNNKTFKKTFTEFYKSTLNFFPIAIFVNKDTTINQIHLEIKRRLRSKTIPVIKIHAIGKENILTKNRALKSLDIESKIEFSSERKNNLEVKEEITTIKVVKNFE